MQRDFLPNAYRGINELPSSQSSNEPMDVDNNVHQSIIQQVDNDQIDSSKRNHITNRSLFKSIVQTPDNDTASYTQLPLVNTANNESSSAQATGLDPNFSAAIDADEALARELQQKEYSRDSIIPNRHPYERFRIPSDDEIRVIDPAHNSEPDVMPNFNTDEEFAAYLQAQENRKRERFHRRQFPFFPVPPRPTPTSENGQPPNDLVFPGQIRFRPSANDEDDEDNDDDEYRTFHMNDVHPLFRLLGNPHFNHEGISPFMLGHRRNYRRTGNLQDTEDDFGPEDYERLLQLDDTIRKKKLSQSQINSIKEVLFHSNAKNTDEENKCGVCLEHFEENQTLRQFPCSHVYHKQCADRWLRENNVCPICRKPPVDIQSSSSNSRHHHHHKSSNNTSRRPQAANRSSTNRQHSTHNSSTMSTNSQSRRGPPFQRPS